MTTDLEPEDRTALRYLFGELTPAERDDFEARYFGDAELSAAIAAVEDDLLDAYVRNELDPEQRRKVEEHLLATDAQRRRLRNAAAIQNLAGERRMAPLVRMPSRTRWLTLAAAAAIVVVAGLAVVLSRRQPVELPAQVVATTPVVETDSVAPAPAVVPRERVVQTLVLAASVTRSDGAGPEVRLKADAVALRLELELLEGDDRAPSYHVLVQRADGTPVLQREDARAERGRVLVEIPRGALEPGEYEVLLSADGELLAQHVFRVLP